MSATVARSQSAEEPVPEVAQRISADSSLDFAVAFDTATLDYESGHYQQCVSAFRRLLKSALPVAGPAQSRGQLSTYLSACLVASGQLDAARQQFRIAILEDRNMSPPDPIVFPRAVVDLFVQVRNRLMATLRRQQEEELAQSRAEIETRRKQEKREKARVIQLERLVATETVVRRNERWMAWVPLGIGQFHNGDNPLGWGLLATESALAVAALTATSVELGLHSQGQGGRSNLDATDLTQTIEAAHDVATVSWISLLAVAAAGIAEAHYSYRSEVNLGTRPRVPVSPEESLRGARSVTPLVTNRWLGIQGRF